MNGKSGLSISRREFARRAAIVSAVSLMPPGTLQAGSAVAQPLPQQPPEIPSLSPETQAEAEARFQAILAVYGARFSDAQKLELRRLCFLGQPPLDRLRSYPIENGDAPALYLKPLMEREKKFESPPISSKSKSSAKKS
jgi:hypothetical protein